MNYSKFKSLAGKIFFSLCTMISPTLNTKLRYKRVFNKKLDLDQPKTFNEKILWLKVNNYNNNPLVIKCADKYLVREYVTECGLENILIPLIGVYDSAYDIKWKDLPRKFVLKWNYGATMNIICSDKEKTDEKKMIEKLDSWKNVKYWLPFAEMQYKEIKKKIICEEFVESDSLDGDLPDYKIFCFNGKPMCTMVCTGRTNGSDSVHAKYVLFDIDWKVLPYSEYAIKNAGNINIPKPDGLDYAIRCAEILSRPFPFVRADFYIVNKKVYFGELTFTPAGGMDTDLFSGDEIMGSYIHLE